MNHILKNDRIYVEHSEGIIKRLKMKRSRGGWIDVFFHQTYKTGPAWQIDNIPVKMEPDAEYLHAYCGEKDGMCYRIRYSILEDGILNIHASVENKMESDKCFDAASLVLGINTYMEAAYESYKNLFFPTLLRCEKTHLWGYFQSPSNQVLAIAVDAPVSSYRLDYESGEHRIHTAILDLMQKNETLPERHPHSNALLKAGECRSWNVKLKLCEEIHQVKEDITKMISVPTIEISKYTVSRGESTEVTVYSVVPVTSVMVDKLVYANVPNVRSKDGETDTRENAYVRQDILTNPKTSGNRYTFVFTPAAGEGVYRLRTESNGYQAEAMVTQRNSWKWYMEHAKQAAIEHPAKAADCCESWYGLFSGYLGKKYFPNAEQDAKIDEIFDNVYQVIGYDEEGIPNNNPMRIQNHSTTVSILTDKYEASGELSDLEKAVKIADYLVNQKQTADGAYQGPGGDYTSVVYPAKSIMELMYHEKALSETAREDRRVWEVRFRRHYDSVKRAMDHLIAVDGELHTEGQQTFEDGVFACSATQLSEFALYHPEGSEEREKYKAGAASYMRKHEALEQQLIPDSRMNGGTLRFWEAQYDTLVTAEPNNMMNSPHGWSAWNIYALFNMYELTGEAEYLRKGMNAIGSCAQLMGFDGNLYWAFIADPYIKGILTVQKRRDSSEYGEKASRSVILGETYVDMITDWWKTPKGLNVRGYLGQGGSCDNDVHEIFKAIEANVLTKAYVIENEDGTFETYNCTAKRADEETVRVRADSEELTSEIHFNMKTETSKCQIIFSAGTEVNTFVKRGMSVVEKKL